MWKSGNQELKKEKVRIRKSEKGNNLWPFTLPYG
jgi:hypothetical protein